MMNLRNRISMRRAQIGATLMEVLVAMSISLVVSIPLLINIPNI